jgi:hypothetical protein
MYFPPQGGVLLKELVGMNLVVGDLPPVIGQKGKTWLPEDLTVDINGVQVLTRDLRGKRLGPGDRVDLEYPDPVQVQTPKLASTMVRIGTVPQ